MPREVARRPARQSASETTERCASASVVPPLVAKLAAAGVDEIGPDPMLAEIIADRYLSAALGTSTPVAATAN